MKVEDIMTKDAMTIPYNSTVADAINAIRKHHVHEILVTKNDILFGVVSSRQIIERSTRLNEKISTITVSPVVLEKDVDVEDAIEKLLFGGHRDIPVVDNGNLIGVVSEIDVLTSLGALKSSETKKITAKDCMSPINFVCDEECPISDVRKSLIMHNVNRVPIVDKGGKLAGIISTIDLVERVGYERKFHAGDRIGERIELEKIPAKSLMKKDVFSVKEGETLNNVIGIISKNRVSSVVVEDAGRPAGIITPKSILRLFYKPKETHPRIEITGVKDKELRFLIAEFFHRKMEKFERILKIESSHIDVKEHRRPEGGIKYEVKGKLLTGRGAFYASDIEWNIFKCVNEIAEKFWKETSKKIGKGRAKQL